MTFRVEIQTHLFLVLNFKRIEVEVESSSKVYTNDIIQPNQIQRERIYERNKKDNSISASLLNYYY